MVGLWYVCVLSFSFGNLQWKRNEDEWHTAALKFHNNVLFAHGDLKMYKYMV